jgi:hypothetical protein
MNVIPAFERYVGIDYSGAQTSGFEPQWLEGVHVRSDLVAH